MDNLRRSRRLFLPCPRCFARVARVYGPTTGAAPACRRCWGLRMPPGRTITTEPAGRCS